MTNGASGGTGNGTWSCDPANITTTSTVSVSTFTITAAETQSYHHSGVNYPRLDEHHRDADRVGLYQRRFLLGR